METLVLTACVVWEDGVYTARVYNLPLEGTGETVQKAQDQLISAMRAWIELYDGTSRLEQVLARAGFPGVEEDTELELQFIELP
jgi:hypothetical protein